MRWTIVTMMTMTAMAANMMRMLIMAMSLTMKAATAETDQVPCIICLFDHKSCKVDGDHDDAGAVGEQVCESDGRRCAGGGDEEHDIR